MNNTPNKGKNATVKADKLNISNITLHNVINIIPQIGWFHSVFIWLALFHNCIKSIVCEYVAVIWIL